MKSSIRILSLLVTSLYLAGCSPVIIGAAVVAGAAGGGGGGGGGGGIPPTQVVVQNVQVMASEADTFADISFTLNPPLEELVVINVQTTDGTARAGVDFEQPQFPIGISPFFPSSGARIRLINNDDFVGDRQFTVTLTTNTPGIVIVTPNVTVTIQEDELDPATATQVLLQNTVDPGTVGQPLNSIQANIQDDAGNVLTAFKEKIAARFRGPTGQYIGSQNIDGMTTLTRAKAADINGDGRLDVVVLSPSPDILGTTFSVFLNTTVSGSGDLTFGAPIVTSTITSAASFEIADINADNRLDVLVGSTSSGLRIHRQDPSNPGQFLPPQTISNVTVTRPFKVRDLNNDQLADIVVGRGPTILLQSAVNPGTFDVTTLQTLEADPADLVIRDFNGDGRLDILTAASSGAGALLTQRDGSGSNFGIDFQIPGTAGFVTFQGVTRLADLNGDGVPDVVSLTSGQGVLFFFRDPNNLAEYTTIANIGSTSTLPFGITVLDVDGKGNPDILWSNGGEEGVSVLLADENENFGFSRERIVLGFSPALSLQGDFNGNGQQDLLNVFTGAPRGQIMSLYPGDAAQSLGIRANLTQPVASPTQGMALGDVNGDNRPDLVVALDNTTGSGNAVVVQLQEPNSPLRFRPLAPISTGANPVDVKIGDLNNDGRNDILVCEEGSGNARILLQNATSPEQFDAGALVLLGVGPRRVEIGDMNADGRNDFVGLSTADNQLTVALQSTASPGQFNSTLLSTLIGAEDIQLDDFNQDGRMDILVGYNGLNVISFFFQDSTNPGQFLNRVDIIGNSVEAIRSGDLNNDGVTDFITADRSTNTLTPFFQSPTTPGLFNRGIAVNLPTESAKGIEIVDLNGDGIRDIAFTNDFISTNGNNLELVVAFQSPSSPGQFMTPRAVSAGPGVTKLQSVDFDGDGRMELGINGLSGYTVIMRQDSTLLNGARLTGNLVLPNLGVATFNNLVIDGQVSGAQLEFVSAQLRSAVSNVFNVN